MHGFKGRLVLNLRLQLLGTCSTSGLKDLHQQGSGTLGPHQGDSNMRILEVACSMHRQLQLKARKTEKPLLLAALGSLLSGCSLTSKTCIKQAALVSEKNLLRFEARVQMLGSVYAPGEAPMIKLQPACYGHPACGILDPKGVAPQYVALALTGVTRS